MGQDAGCYTEHDERRKEKQYGESSGNGFNFEKKNITKVRVWGEKWQYSPMARAPTKEAMRAFSPLFTSVPSPTTAASDMVNALFGISKWSNSFQIICGQRKDKLSVFGGQRGQSPFEYILNPT